ncbi:adenosine deaminase [Microbacterium esteraromaticum]|uniref:adenosine deaminase n=1 Tax=Microbacterium esteraromaticum TaxID=57043 RepID=A0A7D8A9D0_9MICO|nr:adenosine deaminase [Microbacterium esteraromaticum]QMU95844.1 adenosine deaminase [Microbacterium esteraromaticum]
MKTDELRALPKISLHDHLDGGVRPATILELADASGIAAPAKDPKALGRWFAQQSDAGSLVEYLKTFELVTSVMQSERALTRIAREFVADLAADGVIYGEMRWAPEQHLAGGLSLDDAVRAVQRGIEEGEDEADAAGRSIRVGQILSAMRQNDGVREIAELAVRHREAGVVGFDIAGPEDGFPASQHRAAFDYLAGEFLPVTVHAGEAAGLASIRSALIDGRALRLGHGVRIAEDLQVIEREGDEVQVQFGDLARWVRDREIPLELSPSSNLQTGAVAQWGDELADHPFDLLYQLGFSVTVNVDNRTMSGTSLTRELSLLVDAFGYDLDDLEAFQFNAASAAFLPVEEREELVEMIAEGFER